MEDNSKKLVVYFTRTGNTKAVAAKLANLINADCEEIIDSRSYRGFIGFFRGAYGAIKQRRTKLMPPKYNPDNYDLVILCTPMWAGNITPAVRTYCQQHSLPRIAWVITCGDPKGNIQQYPTEKSTTVAIVKLAQKDIKDNNIDQPLNEFIAKL